MSFLTYYDILAYNDIYVARCASVGNGHRDLVFKVEFSGFFVRSAKSITTFKVSKLT